MADKLLLSDGVSYLLLTDGSSKVLLAVTTSSSTFDDIGQGVDGLAIAAAIGIAELGAGSESMTVGALTTLTVAETGAGVDNLGLGLPTSDSGAGSDSLVVVVSYPDPRLIDPFHAVLTSFGSTYGTVVQSATRGQL